MVLALEIGEPHAGYMHNRMEPGDVEVEIGALALLSDIDKRARDKRPVRSPHGDTKDKATRANRWWQVIASSSASCEISLRVRGASPTFVSRSLVKPHILITPC